MTQLIRVNISLLVRRLYRVSRSRRLFRVAEASKVLPRYLKNEFILV